MARIRIIKKNDEFTQEYEVGDIFEIAGTWYGGVHIEGKTGIPVSLDKEEYIELDTEPVIEETKERVKRDIHVGDIVRHFKREWVSADTSEYLGICRCVNWWISRQNLPVWQRNARMRKRIWPARKESWQTRALPQRHRPTLSSRSAAKRSVCVS